MFFSLSPECNIYIYGGGSLGIYLATQASAAHYHVVAFLDKNASTIKQVNSIPVLTLEECRFVDVQNTVVIITLQNVTQHEELADQICKKGCKKIIYFPMNTLGANSTFVSGMRKKYNECLNFKFEYILKNIPQMGENTWKFNNDIESDVIWIPTELCFAIEKGVKNVRQSDYTESAEALLNKYVRGKSIYNVIPYWNLFEYLEGDRENCELYLKIFGKRGHISDCQKSDTELLEDRNTLLKIYLHEFNMHSSFFNESPCEVCVSDRGKVLILDGLHRSVFLAKKGYRWIPTKVNRENKDYFFERKCLKELITYINENRIQKIEFPIEHPIFYGFPVYRCEFITLWEKILQYIDSKNLTINVCGDFSYSDGYFARNLFRLGGNKVYLNKIQNKWEDLVTELFDIGQLTRINCVNEVVSQCDFMVLTWKQLLNLDWQEKNKYRGVICVIDIPSGEIEKLKKTLVITRMNLMVAHRYCLSGSENYMVFIDEE